MHFYIVDCFAEDCYQGNQLLVVRTEGPVHDALQQQIAREINFSETAFILSDKQENGGYDVRIWTPNVGEVPFAGHPTLGTAYVIRHTLGDTGEGPVLLNLKVGQIPVFDAENGMTMRQNPPRFGAAVDKGEIAAVFGLDEADIRDDYPVQWASTGLEAVLIPLQSRDALKKIRMDREAFCGYIGRYPQNNCNHLFFTDMGNARFAARCMMEDFVEDPATGSANGNLAAYLLQHDYFGCDPIVYTVHQGEDMGRPSVLHVRAGKKDGVWNIEVGGGCRIIAEGEWR